jgi:hypothetical protein
MEKQIDYWAGTKPVLNFTVEPENGHPYYLPLEVKQLVHCGRTSRDPARLPRHTALAPGARGTTPAASGPVAFSVPPVNATQTEKVCVYDRKNNAEVEPVLLFDEEGRQLIAVGSDHADRALESLAGPKSKLWSPKVISQAAWLYEDVKSHWDELILKLWGYPDGQKQPYMNDRTAAILSPEAILEVIRRQCPLTGFKNTVVFCGSVSFLTPEMMWGPAWDLELFDPVAGRSLRHQYEVEVAWT